MTPIMTDHRKLNRHYARWITVAILVICFATLAGCENYLSSADAGYERYVQNRRAVNNKQAEIARDYAGSVANRVIWEMDKGDQCVWEAFVMDKSADQCGSGGTLTPEMLDALGRFKATP